MKKLLFMLALLLTVAVTTECLAAQKPKDKKIETSQFLTDISCEKCEAKVMNYLPFQKGIKDVQVDLKTKIITVKYDSEKSSVEAITGHFSKLDITAKLADKPASCCDTACPTN